MKKYLPVVLGMVFLITFAVSAYAEVTLGGDARVRGIMKQNYDFNKDIKDNDRFYDYRIRLKTDVTAEGGTGVHARLSLTDWNEIWGGRAGKEGTERTDVLMDYAYINVPVMKDVSVIAGKVVVDWGNKLKIWDERAYRLIVATKVAKDTTIRAFTQKNLDSGKALDLKDDDMHAVNVTTKLGDLDAGAMLTYRYDRADYVAAAVTERTANKTGSTLDLFARGKVGDLGIKGEVELRGGGREKATKYDGSRKAPYAGFIGVDYKIGNTTVDGLFAFTQNGYTADDNFNPMNVFGTAEAHGIGRRVFGGCLSTTATCNTNLLAVGATQKVTGDLSLYGRLGYATFKRFSGTRDFKSMNGLDAGLTYKINKSTAYKVDIAYVNPSKDLAAKDDAIIGLAHRLEVSF